MSFLKKAWPFLLAVCVVSIGGFLFGHVSKPQAPIKIYTTVTPETGTLSPAEASRDEQSQDISHHEQTPGAEQFLETVHETETQHYHIPDVVDVDVPDEEKHLTDIEKSLLEAGYDLTKLPRGPNGELLRGPNGGIALVSPEEYARIESERPLRERSTEIMEELKTYADRDISNEEFLSVIGLHEEYLRLQEDLGSHISGTDVSPHFEYFRFMAKHSTVDGRIPTAQASRYLELLEKVGSDTPESYTRSSEVFAKLQTLQ